MYLDTFLGLDGDELKELKLDLHISKGGDERDTGLKVASIIKVLRSDARRTGPSSTSPST